MLHASASFPSHWVPILDLVLVIAGLALAVAGCPPLTRAGQALKRGLRLLARRPALAILGLALGCALYLAAHTAISGAPLPRVVDEWSYLLAADTFAHNRLTNPPHPMARHFDGDHVLQSPTYASKYPPAQGFVLAVGEVAFGHPVAGLWLEAAALVGAVGWMLLAWVPRPWAIFGAILVSLRLGAGSYWNESYWGGSVAAIGGALVFGAARRLWRRVTVLDSALLALGLAILASSRPYEGGLVSLTIAALLACGLLTRRLRPSPWLRLVLPVGILLAAAIAGLGAVNDAITGNPLVFPHQLYDRAHHLPPVFLWEPLPGAGGAVAGPDGHTHGWRAPRTSGWHRLAVSTYFFLGLSGILALLATPAMIRDPWSRFATIAFLVVAAGHFLIYPWWPHYDAPALAALLVPALQGHRLLYVARRHRRGARRSAGHRVESAGGAPVVGELRPPGTSGTGRRSRRAFGPALFAVACASQLAVFLVQIPSQRADPTDPSRQRARLAWDFEHRPGRHLVLVTYPPGWGSDWTYNPADIDAAKVVWATDLGAEADAELLRYYPDRTVWAVDASFTATDPVPRLVRPARSAPSTAPD